MTGSVGDTALTYLGWSGFILRYPEAPPLVIDAQDDSGIPHDEDICLVVTHGHPEHVAGTAAWLRNKTRTAAASVFASPGVCNFLARRSGPATVSTRASRASRTMSAGSPSTCSAAGTCR